MPTSSGKLVSVSYPVEDQLTPEIWYIVFSLLDRKSLNATCRTSRYFLKTARPRLYRNVRLLANPYPSSTMELLNTDKELARRVQSAEIILNYYYFSSISAPSSIEKSRRDFQELLFNLSHLKRLVVEGMLFSEKSEQAAFVQQFQTRETLLQELSFSGEASSAVRLPSGDLPLAGLTQISWNNRVETNPGFCPLWSILDSSRETLEDIFLPFTTSNKEFISKLWKTYFPRLRSFTTGLSPSPEMAAFLHSHGVTLEEINLSYGPVMFLGRTFEVHGNQVNSHPIPLAKLRSFEGLVSTFLKLTKGHANDLCKLGRLAVLPTSKIEGWTCEDQIRDTVEVLLSAKGNTSSGLPIREVNLGLKHCSDESDDFIIEAINDCARVFGNTLEVWWDELKRPIAAETFASFPKLREIHLRASALGKGADLDDSIAMGIIEAYVKKLAAHCTRLEEVHISNPWGDSFVKRVSRRMGDLCVE